MSAPLGMPTPQWWGPARAEKLIVRAMDHHELCDIVLHIFLEVYMGARLEDCLPEIINSIINRINGFILPLCVGILRGKVRVRLDLEISGDSAK